MSGKIDPRAARSRRLIAQAVYDLHRTIGPARTTISAVAAQAGVERLTVYRHFPTELDLHRACLAHWRELHPWPEPEPWGAVRDPEERLRTALPEVYAFYADVEPLFVLGTADMPKLPALQEADRPLFEHWDRLRETLLAGWGARGRRRVRLSAAIAAALDFQTWHLLARREGLGPDEVVDLMVGLVRSAARPASAA